MRFGVVLMLLFMAGCSTAPISESQAKRVPFDRIGVAFATQTAGTSPVKVRRDAGFLAGGCGLAFHIDGAEAVTLEAGEQAQLYAPVGKRIFSARTKCPLGPVVMGELMADVEPERASVIRLGIIEGGAVLIQPTAF